MNKPLTLALLAGLALSACATAPESAPKLDGTQWALATADQGELASLNGGGITLSFSADQLAGYSGCNQYSASYSLSEGRLSVGPVAATKRLCPGEGSNAERAWFALLGTPMTVTSSADTLELRAGNGTTLRFEPQEAAK